MKILVTGAKGFIGKNLISELKNQKYTDILECNKDTDIYLLNQYCREANFVYHLAGVNRPVDEAEFMEGNYEFTLILLNALKVHNNNCPIMMSSSIQAELNNPYGMSKKAGEDLLFDYSKQTGAKVFIYRFPNVFGKWSRPNYNSVVATFCYNITHELPIIINNLSQAMELVYIDDVVVELINALQSKENKSGLYCNVLVTYATTVGEISDLLYSFKKSRKELSIPNMADIFAKKLYSTYLSYLPEDEFSYDLKMNTDDRGFFAEFIKTLDRGQISINTLKPNVIKGNHWHHTKNEKFLVVSGTGVIRLRRIGFEKVIEYYVNGDKMQVLDIPTGYTHNIENLGDTDLVTIMWVNECYNPEIPDTYYLEV